MLHLRRRKDEVIRIGKDIEIVIISVKGMTATFGIFAPKEVHIIREELIGTPPKEHKEHHEVKITYKRKKLEQTT